MAKFLENILSQTKEAFSTLYYLGLDFGYLQMTIIPADVKVFGCLSIYYFLFDYE